MRRTVLIGGYGPSTAHSMAKKFGEAGHSVALIARNSQRLADGVTALESLGIEAQAFVADLGDVNQVRQVIANVRAAMGPIHVLHWNAFTDVEGDLITLPAEVLSQSLSVRVVGYIAAVQAALQDLEFTQGAVLATNGVTAINGFQTDIFAKEFAGLAIPAAAQHKATALLTQTLGERGVYVGEVVVHGFVKGSAGADGYVASIDPDDVAEQFWQLNITRHAHSVSLVPH